MLIVGCRWQDLPREDSPREDSPPTTMRRRLNRWGEAGVWEHISCTSLPVLDQHGKLDWSVAFLDGSFVPAKKGGEKSALTCVAS